MRVRVHACVRGVAVEKLTRVAIVRDSTRRAPRANPSAERDTTTMMPITCEVSRDVREHGRSGRAREHGRATTTTRR